MWKRSSGEPDRGVHRLLARPGQARRARHPSGAARRDGFKWSVAWREWVDLLPGWSSGRSHFSKTQKPLRNPAACAFAPPVASRDLSAIAPAPRSVPETLP